MATRWGIVSAGKISSDFVTAVSTLSRDEHQVVAVAARSLDSARAFALKHNITAAYGSYEELAKDKNIDVVYIGSIHPQHFELGKLMLENGKPILCEKPLTVNLKQTSELIGLARKKNLFLMEAIWSRCFPAYDFIKSQIDAGEIGEVQQVIANFGVKIQDVDRVKYKELGGGSILDLGVYCIQLAVFVFGTTLPDVHAYGSLNEHGVDTDMAAILKYGGKTAVLSTHTKAELPNEAFIVGTKGTLKVPAPFWCPTAVVSQTSNHEFALTATDGQFNFHNSVGLSYEAVEVRRCLKLGLVQISSRSALRCDLCSVNKHYYKKKNKKKNRERDIKVACRRSLRSLDNIEFGLLESPKVTHAESLVISELEDSIRKQVGVVYAEDS